MITRTTDHFHLYAVREWIGGTIVVGGALAFFTSAAVLGLKWTVAVVAVAALAVFGTILTAAIGGALGFMLGFVLCFIMFLGRPSSILIAWVGAVVGTLSLPIILFWVMYFDAGAVCPLGAPGVPFLNC